MAAKKTPKKSNSKAEIKPKSKKGGSRKGSGRKPNPINEIRKEFGEIPPDVLARIDAALMEFAPQCVANLIVLANGGYERVEEKWEITPSIDLVPIGQPRPEPELSLAERKVSVAEPDRAANIYILDRVLGKPKQAVEVGGKDGKPIPLALISLPPGDLDDLERIIRRVVEGGPEGGA